MLTDFNLLNTICSLFPLLCSCLLVCCPFDELKRLDLSDEMAGNDRRKIRDGWFVDFCMDNRHIPFAQMSTI